MRIIGELNKVFVDAPRSTEQLVFRQLALQYRALTPVNPAEGGEVTVDQSLHRAIQEIIAKGPGNP